VEEAGGKVTDMFGEDQRYDKKIKGCIISNGLVHEELAKIVRASLYS
jgi:fructose-1,6-bisphosphatase/inositol monophosphatase family enzyme